MLSYINYTDSYMKFVACARAIGGSLVITVPRQAVKQECLRSGELVEMEVRKFKPSFFGALKGIGSFSHGDEMKAHD